MAYAIALTTSILGRTVLAVRLPTALASAGTVFVLFWLGYLLFGRDEESGRATPWRGLLVGGVGAGLLAVSIGQTVIGRNAFRANFLPFLLSLCLALLWWGWRQRELVAGRAGGRLRWAAGVHLYPAQFHALSVSLLRLELCPAPSPCYREQSAGRCAQGYLPWVGVFVGVAGLVAAPLIIYFALHPEHFFVRSRQLWIFDPIRSQGDPLWEHFWSMCGRISGLWFSRRSELAAQLRRPAYAESMGSVLFLAWCGYGRWRWQRPAYRLLLLWLGVMILPAMVARDIRPQHFLRMIGAVPAIYLLVAVGVWEAFRFLQERFFRKMLPKLPLLWGRWSVA